jgi:acetyl-CoA C-acetyltransferase
LFFVDDLAETVAQTCLISRDDQDEFALQSQLKCAQAMSLGHFDAEIEPIVISTPKGTLNKKICIYFSSLYLR